MLWRVLTQVTHKAISVFHTITMHTFQLPAPMLTAHLLSSSARSSLYVSLSVNRFKLVVASLNTFWSNQRLVFCSTIVVSSYSNIYELLTVITVVSC
ncbi:unnamed protein product [Hymenolepis diminuta]|uniref:Uncharacterized protein n=1 Tax=Hymenolepis diminuta TaxID=6216 RepID=A0A564XXR6_HYMDI|nr:unnamed protein product [Hymenolepis diminuta]